MSECCPDPACSHALYSAVQKETGHLTCQERQIILNVLGRDEMLRREEEQRLMRLKAELQALRRRGALKSGDWSSPPLDPDRTCGRCRVELGRVINRGAYCQSCRLKVCKGCRAYAFRTTDWVCTVCHKRMEIQAVSGEWMNEFVRRPSRRRDNRVYVPAADIIKRTIRRSWTISSPSTRWNSPRSSQPLRPYNSLPRGQDIIKYPSLLPYHHEYSNKRTSPKMQRHTPAQRSHSEDIYAEREVPCHKEVVQLLDDDETRYISTIEILTRPRVNPLAKAAAEGKLTTAVPFEMKTCTPLPEHILNQSNDANEPAEEVTNKTVDEKRVSFEEVIVPKKFDKLFSKGRSKGKDKSILKPQSLDETVVKKSKLFSRRSLPEEIENAEISLNEAEVVENIKEEEIANEQCDIEPFSGTVFRKVTVQRRRQDMRKVPAIDNDESDDIALALKIEDQIEKAYDEQNPISSNVSDPQVTLVTDEQGVEAIGTDAPNTSNDDLKKENESEGETKTEVPNGGQNDAGLSEANSSPMVMAKATNKSGTPSPVSQSSKKDLVVKQGEEWTGNNEEDIDRLVAIHTNRSSLSSLGLRSDSMASVYSGAGEGRYGAVTVRGQVEFRLQYNYKAGALEILIIQCKDLAAVDAKRNRSDPYVKVYLLPDKSKSGKRKTKVRKHTLNPVFDECLKFHISITGLETRTLWLTVWHSDMFGRNDFLGEVRMALENKIFDDPTPKWYNLQERTEPFEDVLSFKGDILVGLKFVPPDMTVVKKGKRSRGTLHVKVKEAKSLTAVKSNGTSDPFCKSYLLPDKGRTSKQKTAVIRKTINAVWNHTFLYDDVTLQELAERCLELTVWDHDRLGSNEFLGGVRFSLGEGKYYGKSVDWMDSTGKEVSLWKSMLERPNFWVEGCLPLRPTLDYRTS